MSRKQRKVREKEKEDSGLHSDKRGWCRRRVNTTESLFSEK